MFKSMEVIIEPALTHSLKERLRISAKLNGKKFKSAYIVDAGEPFYLVRLFEHVGCFITNMMTKVGK